MAAVNRHKQILALSLAALALPCGPLAGARGDTLRLTDGRVLTGAVARVSETVLEVRTARRIRFLDISRLAPADRRRFEPAGVPAPPSDAPSATPSSSVPVAPAPADSAYVDRLLSQLGDRNPFKREDAAKKLGQLREPRAIGALEALFGDEHSYVCATAVRSLIQIGGPDVVEPLIRALAAPNEDVHAYAAAALGQFGDARAAKPLHDMAAARGAQWDVAVEALGRLADAGLPYLETLVQDPDLHERMPVYEAIAATGTGSVAVLTAALECGPDEDRPALAATLGNIGDARAVPALIEALKDAGNAHLRGEAAGSLGRLGDPAGLDALSQALDAEPEDAVACLMIDALASHPSPRAAAAILAAAGAEDADRRRPALQALGHVHAGKGRTPDGLEIPADVSAAVDALRQALDSRNDTLRQAAAEALGKIADPRAAPLLVPLLSADARALQTRAVAALDAMGWQPADDAERIAYLMARRDWRRLAALGERAVAPLIAALNSRDAALRAAAARTLGAIGDRRAVQPLARKLMGSDRAVHASARSALEALGGDDAMAALDDYRRAVTGKTRATEWSILGLALAGWAAAARLAARGRAASLRKPAVAFVFAAQALVLAGFLLGTAEQSMPASVFRIVFASIAALWIGRHMLLRGKRAEESLPVRASIREYRGSVAGGLAFLALAMAWLVPHQDLKTLSAALCGLALIGASLWDFLYAARLSARVRESGARPGRSPGRIALSAAGLLLGFPAMCASGFGLYFALQSIGLDMLIHRGSPASGWGVAFGLPILAASALAFAASALLYTRRP